MTLLFAQGGQVEVSDAEAEVSREEFFERAHERFKEGATEVVNMILTVVKAQIIVEWFTIELLEAHGKDPKHFLLYCAEEITELKKIVPSEVGQATWELLSLCSYVRNELVHSLDNKQLKALANAVVRLTPRFLKHSKS